MPRRKRKERAAATPLGLRELILLALKQFAARGRVSGEPLTRSSLKLTVCTLDVKKRKWGNKEEWKRTLNELMKANKLVYNELDDTVAFSYDSSDDEMEGVSLGALQGEGSSSSQPAALVVPLQSLGLVPEVL